MNLLTELQKLYDENPSDAFNAYALALELQKDSPEQALELFQKILEEQPEYLATYYHAGVLMADMDYIDLAIKTIRKGIALASQIENTRTSKELQALLSQILIENDMEY